MVTRNTTTAGWCVLIGLFVAATPTVDAQTYSNVRVIGSQSVYRGHDLYLELTPLSSSGSKLSIKWRIDSVDLSGTLVPFEVLCGNAACGKDAGGRFLATGKTILRVPIAAGTAAGQYKLTIRSESANTVVPLTVKLPEPPLASGPLAGAPPMEGLAKWESTMKTHGKKWCPSSTAKLNFDNEAQVWYYDGARVYFQMADYTGDKSWETCALRIARQHRDHVIAKNGKLQGWRVFTAGLRMAWERTKDPSFKKALVLLASNSAYANSAMLVDSFMIREAAYIADAYMDAERVGEPRNPRLARTIDFLLGHLDQLFVSQNYDLHQVFYDGLAAHALIDYYRLTGDSRIPPAIRIMLDWIWDYGWDKSRSKLIINPEPSGSKCSWGCREYSTDLINFVAPAFAWYWSITGDPVYQQRGDELFAHALDDGLWSGKHFSHNYRWSFAAVEWRKAGDNPKGGGEQPGGGDKPPAGKDPGGKQPDAPCSYSITPGPFWITPTGGSVTVNVTASNPACEWTAGSGAWLTPAPAGTRKGSGSVVYSAKANTSGSTRALFLLVAGQSTYFGQSTAPATSSCTYTVTPGPFWIRSTGGSVTIHVTASSPACQWTAGTSSWLSATPGTKTGSGSVVYSAGANKTGATRALFVRVAGQSTYFGQAAQK